MPDVSLDKAFWESAEAEGANNLVSPLSRF